MNLRAHNSLIFFIVILLLQILIQLLMETVSNKDFILSVCISFAATFVFCFFDISKTVNQLINRERKA